MSQKTIAGKTPRQRRKERRLQDEELLKAANSGMDIDELYDDPVINEPEAKPSKKDDLASLIEEQLTPEEKMYDGMMVELPGPTSLDELDKEREERKKAQEVREVAWDTEDVVSNIIRSPELSPEDKAKKMSQAGEDMAVRINKIVGMTKEVVVEEEEFDYDLASAEILMSMDDKSIVDQVSDFITKAILTNGARENLSDSDFALVVECGDEKLRSYPIHDKAHVRKSLATAAEMIKKGGVAGADAKSAMVNIRVAAKEFGIGQPSEKNNNGIIIHKEDDGSYRFVGWLTGKWVDRENEIIPESAHKEFEQFLVDNPDYQISFRSWHTIGTDRTHPIDFWKYQSGFVIVSGKLTDNEAVAMMKIMQKQRIGMSHGFLGKKDEQDQRTIIKYRTFEVSDLLLDNAAFPWSSIPEIMEEKSMNTKIEYLREVVGEEKLAKILSDTELKESFLQQSGIEAKQLDALLAGEDIPDAEPVKKEVVEQETPELSPEVVALMKSALGLENFDLETFKEAMAKAETSSALLPALMKKLDEVSTALEAGQKSAEVQLAELLTGSAAKAADIKAKSKAEAEDNIVDENDEKFKAALPKHEDTWLAEIAGVDPVSK